MTFQKIPQLTRKDVDRFWEKVQILPSGCWEWQAGRTDENYGQFRIRGKHFVASRVAYFIYYGVDPGDLQVLHVCDNPPCVCPFHLFKGTNSDNMQDMIAKGRANYAHPDHRGEKNPKAAVTENDVREIRRRLTNGEDRKIVSKDYPLGKTGFDFIASGRTWKHI